MTDLALVPQGSFVDLVVESNDLKTDDGLETAVILSLFLDRRASDEDVMQPGQTDRRGWFGDAAPVVDGDKYGSRLWMLEREKQTADVVARAKEYCEESLKWLVDDRIASSVDVTAEIVTNGVLGISVIITKPLIDAVRFDFNYTWAAQSMKRG